MMFCFSKGDNCISLFQIYNTSKGEWETGLQLNTPRAHAASIGKLIVTMVTMVIMVVMVVLVVMIIMIIVIIMVTCSCSYEFFFNMAVSKFV